jgi:hypothetical protein
VLLVDKPAEAWGILSASGGVLTSDRRVGAAV